MANTDNNDNELDFDGKDNKQNEPAKSLGSNLIKDPDDWATGDEPMTGAQKSYVKTLAGDEASDDMTKAEAAKFIDEHKQQGTGGASGGGGVSNAVKDPDNWVTGDEAMTDAQRSYLKTLSDEAGESTEENLSKAEASKRIEELQQKTGRGVNEQDNEG